MDEIRLRYSVHAQKSEYLLLVHTEQETGSQAFVDVVQRVFPNESEMVILPVEASKEAGTTLLENGAARLSNKVAARIQSKVDFYHQSIGR